MPPLPNTESLSPMPLLPNTVTLVLIGEYGEHSDISYDEHSSNNEKKMCIITLDGYDLYFIVNGKKDDPIEICNFYSTFTNECIWKAWCNIRFIPMNKKWLEYFKLRQELGVGEAGDDTNQELGN